MGAIARSVADVASFVSVAAGPDPRDRHSLPELGVDWLATNRMDGAPLRVAYSADLNGLVTVDPQVRATFLSGHRGRSLRPLLVVDPQGSTPVRSSTSATLPRS